MRGRVLVMVLFFVSGGTGLVYEVVWTRQLALLFGVTVFAAASVLAAFMGGLALGSYLFGRLADRHRNPVRVYALLEAGVGLSALAVPLLLDLLQPVYVALARALEGHFVLFNFARAALAGIPLLIPTTLMGGTVPAIGRYLIRQRDTVGWNVGLLYAVNTFGAVVGCVAAGFLLVPSYRLSWIIVATAAVNLAIAAVLLLGKVGEPGVEPPERVEARRRRPAPHARLAMAVFGLSGFAALGYEILWTRSLVLYVHNSTYAFTLMLATFLIGLALGGALMVRVYDRLAPPLFWLGVVEVLVGLSIVLAVLTYGFLPELSFGILGTRAVTNWGQALALMSIRAGLVLLPTTIFLGMVFPLVARIVCGGPERVGRQLGSAYALNTAGAIAGTLATAFLLIPTLGLRGTMVLLSGMNVMLGAACVAASARSRSRGLVSGGAVLAVALVPILAIPETLFSDALQGDEWKIIYYREGVTDTTAVWQSQKTGHRWITYADQRGTAGTHSDVPNRRQAHIAHLLHPAPRLSLQIGFGVGNTLAAAALHPEVERLDCVELSPHVRQTAPYFWTNREVLEHPKVRLIIDDGRNFLLRTTETYDVITLEPPEIFTAEVVNLYTTEFYRLADAALSDEGLLSQWIPAYAMGELEARMLVRSMAEVFPELSIWHQTTARTKLVSIVLVGSKQRVRLDPATLERRMSDPALEEDLRRVGMGTPDELLFHFVAGTHRVRRWVRGVRPVSDDWTYVDYSSPTQSMAGFGFGALRAHEWFPTKPEARRHLGQLAALHRRLQEPPDQLLASADAGRAQPGERPRAEDSRSRPRRPPG